MNMIMRGYEYMLKRERLFSQLFLFLFVLIGYGMSQYNALSNWYWLDDDWPQHLLWGHQYYPNYFQDNDFYLRASAQIQPWGYYALNRILLLFIDPIWISKLMPFFTLWISTYFTFFLLKDRFNWLITWSGVVLIAYFALEKMVGGLARSYAFPLIIGFIYYLVNEKQKGILWLLFLSALFYPISFLINCVIWFVFRLTEWCFDKEIQWNVAFIKVQTKVIATIAFCISLLLYKSYLIKKSPFVGPFLDKDTLTTLPEFRWGGRVNFIDSIKWTKPWDFQWHSFLKLPLPNYGAALVGILSLVILLNFVKGDRSKKHFDRMIFSLFSSGIILFYLAVYFLPHLFLPDRYIYCTFIPFLFFMLLRSFDIISGIFKNNKTILVILYAGLVCYTLQDVKSFQNLALHDYGKHEGVYKAINKIQEPVLVAGPPSICSHIPTFCKQSVLFSDEAAHGIYFKHYYNYVKPRVDSFIEAYTTTSSKGLVEWINEYDIDFLIVDKGYLESKKIWLYQPYKNRLKKKLADIPAENLYFNKIPDDLYIEADWKYKILDCKALLQRIEQGELE